MITSAPRNIHISAEPDETPGVRALPRLRDVTNDPLREYASRAGAVEPLPDSVAALILSKKGRCIVERGQIKATIGGVEREYASRTSMVIAELNGTGRRVLWFANRRKPECIHLCTDDGVYLETIPLKGEAAWFSQDETSQAALATAVAHRQAEARRLTEIHAPDIAAATAREQHNAGELANRVREDERTVRTFAAPAAPVQAARSVFPKAEALAAVDRQLDESRVTDGELRQLGDRVFSTPKNTTPAHTHDDDCIPDPYDLA